MVGGGATLLGKARQGKVSQPVPAHALRGVGMRRRVRVKTVFTTEEGNVLPWERVRPSGCSCDVHAG
jgi:hypothetical protein